MVDFLSESFSDVIFFKKISVKKPSAHTISVFSKKLLRPFLRRVGRGSTVFRRRWRCGVGHYWVTGSLGGWWYMDHRDPPGSVVAQERRLKIRKI